MLQMKGLRQLKWQAFLKILQCLIKSNCDVPLQRIISKPHEQKHKT